MRYPFIFHRLIKKKDGKKYKIPNIKLNFNINIGYLIASTVIVMTLSLIGYTAFLIIKEHSEKGNEVKYNISEEIQE